MQYSIHGLDTSLQVPCVTSDPNDLGAVSARPPAMPPSIQVSPSTTYRSQGPFTHCSSALLFNVSFLVVPRLSCPIRRLFVSCCIVGHFPCIVRNRTLVSASSSTSKSILFSPSFPTTTYRLRFRRAAMVRNRSSSASTSELSQILS
jgi:hypothetical protein